MVGQMGTANKKLINSGVIVKHVSNGTQQHTWGKLKRKLKSMLDLVLLGLAGGHLLSREELMNSKYYAANK